MAADLFLVPFLSGLCLALLLPVIGCYLRLRHEWLAALAHAHVAAAGALLGMLAGLPPLAGGLALAGASGLAKPALARRLARGGTFPSLLLAGWAVGVLVTANEPLAERLGHALFDGQLYFAAPSLLLGLAVWLLVALALLYRLSGRLLLSQLYPDFFRLRGQRLWSVHGGFDLLVALSVALATMTTGVMGSFALLFVPPWLAFRSARSWRANVVSSMALGTLAYSLAFVLALWLDQPFGPLLALVLVAIGAVWRS